MNESRTTDLRHTRSAPQHAWGRWTLAATSAAFGAATIASGGRVLFGGPAARAAAGAYVGFVVAGLALGRRWSVAVGATVAAGTAVVFALFGAHVAAGGAFERRTVVAMSLRTVFWIAFTAGAARLLRPSEHVETTS